MDGARSVPDAVPMKLKRVWTLRHYRPTLVGCLCALAYVSLARLYEFVYHFQLEPWQLTLIAQIPFWGGVWSARRLWFDDDAGDQGKGSDL